MYDRFFCQITLVIEERIKKMNKFYILPIPLVANEALPSGIFPAIRELIQEKGYAVFNPSLIQSLAKTFRADICSVAYALFARFVLDEHANAEVASGKELGKVSGVKYVGSPMKTVMSEIKECKDKDRSMLWTDLFFDLYRSGNAHVFDPSRQELATSFLNILDFFPEKEEKLLDQDQDEERYNRVLERRFWANTTALILLDSTYRYLGHIYVWPSAEAPDVLCAQRIRTSVANVKCRSVQGIAPLILSGVQKYALDHGWKAILVKSPIGPMPKLLQSLGFAGVYTRPRFANTKILGETIDLELDKRGRTVEMLSLNNCDLGHEKVLKLIEEKMLFADEPASIARMLALRHPLYYGTIKDPSKETVELDMIGSIREAKNWLGDKMFRRIVYG